LKKLGLVSLSGLCSGEGSVSCNDVLSGPWGEVFGLPLTVPGMFAYCTVVGLAVAPFFNPKVDMISQKGLLAVTTSMAIFSGYLMLVLALKIQAGCPWCYLSATLSLALATLTWVRSGNVAFSKLNLRLTSTSAAATVLASALFYVVAGTEVAIAEARSYLDSGGSAGGEAVVMSAPAVTTQSSDRSIAVAKALQAKGAKMYGAYWCSHCFDQKQLLGREAMRYVDYVECAKDGENSQTKTCKAQQVPGYPTWQVGGELYAGQMSLAELEDIVAGKQAPYTSGGK